MSETILGQTPASAGIRDAIHVAVISVVCADRTLSPGLGVGLNEKGEATARTDKLLGIVDPYLTKTVRKGEVFYLCLFPQSVTGMKHHWSHPSFPEPDAGLAAYAKMQHRFDSKKFEDLARRHRMTYDNLMAVATDYRDNGEEFYLDFDTPSATREEWDEFWKHHAAVTGKEFHPKNQWSISPFRCSC